MSNSKQINSIVKRLKKIGEDEHKSALKSLERQSKLKDITDELLTI